MTKIANKQLINRLHRIEGQVRGIEKMLEIEEDISKVIVQLDAIKASVDSLKRNYVKEHVRSTISDELESVLSLL
jgi:DNA-binding FrmR family transcriptional regulator